MKCLRLTALCILTILSVKLSAQSDYISLQDKEYDLINRLDIKLKKDSVLRFSSVKSLNRQRVTQQLEMIDSLYKDGKIDLQLSAIDKYNLEQYFKTNTDWTRTAAHSFIPTRTSGLFNTSEHLYIAKTKQFSLVIDPLVNLQFGHASDGNTKTFINERGIILRGHIDKVIGFYTALTDAQEKDPLYVQQYVTANNALPGAGFFKDFQTTGYDHFNARGGITFNTGKFLDLQMAYDKLQIGNGYRSLFLSDFSSNYFFLRFAMHVGKVHYESIVAETTAPFTWRVQGQHQSLPKNYMTLHHLSWQVSKKFNLGLYENVMENGADGFKLNYLNTFIFIKAVEQDNGIAGKTNLGLDFKWNTFNNVQVYGQILFNEFYLSEVLHYSKGSWLNKQGLQLGMKYIDAFTIKNLDMQLEANLVRPFVYTNSDSATNLTNFNQPFTHPLGANFREFLVVVKYQPIKKLYLTAKAFFYEKGLDTAGINFGGDIFRSYFSRQTDYGYHIGIGRLTKNLFTSFTASYEILPNFFVEGNVSYRRVDLMGSLPKNDLMLSGGVRWNLARRDFEF